MRIEVPVVVLEGVRDPTRSEVCGGEGTLPFTAAARALLTLVPMGGGPPLSGRIDGLPAAPLASVAVEPGRHLLTLSADVLADPLGTRELELQARSAPAAPEEKQRVLVRGDIVNRSVMPVGRTFLQGVDLLGGNLVRQSTDLELQGRHLELSVVRTYSSSGLALSGSMGVRWAFNYEARLTPFEGCGLYAVTTADGSTQAFRALGGGFVPQRGYHTRLQRLPDGSFEFTDKSATRHHFAEPGPGHRRRLLFVEEPHGDRIELRYDERGLLDEVSEVQPAGGGVRLLVRSLLFAWTTAGGHARVRSVEAAGLGLRVEYAYDAHGNLVSAARFDTDTAGRSIERYSYTSQDPRDRHRLAVLTGPDGHRAEHQFGADGLVKQVVDRPPKGGEATTTFTYDRAKAGEGILRTITRWGANAPVVYVMNPEGSPLRIEETDTQGRRIVSMEWAKDDIYKLGEKDNRGYEARYGYDARGNLVLERARARSGAPLTESRYEYHERFGELVRKTDEKGRVSAWRIDHRTGDLLEAREAEGKLTRYAYDARGNLVERVEEPGGRTRYFDHDTFGHATRVVGADGREEIREFDRRGRRYREADETGAATPPAAEAPGRLP